MKSHFFILSILLIMFLDVSCSLSKNNIRQDEEGTSNYLIKKIKKVNSWYIIYAQRQDQLYKIVVREAARPSPECKKIVIGKCYNLRLKSRQENAPVVNGVKLYPMNYLDVQCYCYDEETVICIEPKKGIYDLYYTDDLRGLFYIRQSYSSSLSK